ncbi:aldehyde dehydrogenase (NAD+) [Yoonia maricola]|uniref:Aldehyde dehydrogenase (NAD+) n=1 Tax=Yoonia maricola TaxID=420999 RepID=A0A2M8WPP8_9RHOB|nr:aldehyde dehydrogenase family protein [Yoonia maricola]PJI92908.1 aldehyde dehydrogenase (NAD+) [Yoonia maricola]
MTGARVSLDRWQEVSGPLSDNTSLAITDPATEKVFATAPVATIADVGDAIALARQNVRAGAMQNIPLTDRALLLRTIAARLLAQTEAFAWMLVHETGKAISVARREVAGAARLFVYFADLCANIWDRELWGDADHDLSVRQEPMGVVAHFVPWNFPLLLAARSLAPALAAGNASIVKASELAPLACMQLVDLIAACDLPAGTVAAITGVGPGIGEHLAQHRDIDLIVFTGSFETGQKVMQSAAKHVTPVVLELGGKSGAIVCEDADIADVLSSLDDGMFRHSGQVCDAMSRLIALDGIHDRLLTNVIAHVRNLPMGSGARDNVIVPLISARQQQSVARAVSQAQAGGAQVDTGGTLPQRTGHYYPATVISHASPDASINQEEVFGPVLSIQRAANLDHAINIANGTNYGLAAGVFTSSINRARNCAARLQAGQIHINEWGQGGCSAPFGGIKHSGIGREKGREGLANYLRPKSVGMFRGPIDADIWGQRKDQTGKVAAAETEFHRRDQ